MGGQSCLSPEAKRLLSVPDDLKDSDLCSAQEDLLKMFLLDDQLMIFRDEWLLGAVDEFLDPFDLSLHSVGGFSSHDLYYRALWKLWPLFRGCQAILLYRQDSRRHPFLERGAFWLTEPLIIKDCIGAIESRRPASLEMVLELTAILERSLGDLVFATEGPQCKVPSLLKDLIVCSDLRSLLGSRPLIFLLHVLLGTPKSVNLRNVAWHGFLLPDEVDPAFVAVLVLAVLTIGHKLTLTSLPTFSNAPTPHRPRVHLTGAIKMLDALTQSSPAIKTMGPVNLFKSRFIDRPATSIPSRIQIVGRVLELYLEANYWKCLCLLLPEWEHLVRVAFVRANGCPERLLTAETTELYTTFDQMLHSKVGTGNNRLLEMLGPGHLDLLKDLLSYPEGPRVRDKVSHGEVDPAAAGADALKACLDLILVSCLDIARTIHPLELDNGKDPIAFAYSSQFHPTALLSESLAEGHRLSLELLANAKDCWPNYLDIDVCFCEAWNHPKVQAAWSTLSVPRKTMMLESLAEVEGFLLDVDGCIRARGYSLANEDNGNQPELWSILRRIAKQVNQVLAKIADNLVEKHRSHEAMALRSRQRATYQKMLDIVPLVHASMVLVSAYLSSTSGDEGYSSETKKLNRRLLKCCENLNTFVDKSTNRWQEAKVACLQLLEDVITVGKEGSSSLALKKGTLDFSY